MRYRMQSNTGLIAAISALLMAATSVVAPLASAMASTPNLTINAIDTSNNPVNGYYVQISQGGTAVSSGFTPASFSLAAGTYSVSVGDYGGYYFSKWSDGTATRAHSVTVSTSGAVTLTAVYSTSSSSSGSTIKVSSQYAGGGALTGMYVQLQSGSTTTSGFTPQTFTVTSGQQYTITPSDYSNAYFNHWSEGTSGRLYAAMISASKTTALTAVYSTTQGGGG